jgi:hypothetical protein
MAKKETHRTGGVAVFAHRFSSKADKKRPRPFPAGALGIFGFIRSA